ncbi:YcfA-like protein [compost metagenome]
MNADQHPRDFQSCWVACERGECRAKGVNWSGYTVWSVVPSTYFTVGSGGGYSVDRFGVGGYGNYQGAAKGGDVNSRELMAKIEADGWVEVRVKGSHHHFKHPTKPGLVTIPHPKKDLLLKTINSILKQAQL